MLARVRKDGINFTRGREITMIIICESRSVWISRCCIHIEIFNIVQFVQAGSSFGRLQGIGRLSQVDPTPPPYKTRGLQQESLDTARVSDDVLSYKRKIGQLSHQQRVVWGQGAKRIQDLSEIAEGENIVIIPGICDKKDKDSTKKNAAFEKSGFHLLTHTKTPLSDGDCCPKSYFDHCAWCCCTATQNLLPALGCEAARGPDDWSEGMIRLEKMVTITVFMRLCSRSSVNLQRLVL